MTNTSNSRTQYFTSLRNKVLESSPKGTQRQNDDRYWKPEVDKAGTGSAIIRFLPRKANEEFPFVQLYSHGFQGPTQKWFIDNCPSSLGGLPSDVCPVCASNTELWNASKDKEDPRKKLVSIRKRKLSYVSNILVVNDPKHPENNGKIFLYKYGKRIFEKIKDMLFPPSDFPDMVPCDVFDLAEGANFKLRQVKQDGYPNYDKSSFDAPSPLELANLDSKLYSLNEILDPKHFKSMEDLTKRFTQVVGESEPAATPEVAPDAPTTKPSIDDDMPVAKPKAKTATVKPVEEPKPIPVATSSEEDYFSQLAKAQN